MYWKMIFKSPRRLNILKMIFRSPRFVPFGVKMTNFRDMSEISDEESMELSRALLQGRSRANTTRWLTELCVFEMAVYPGVIGHGACIGIARYGGAGVFCPKLASQARCAQNCWFKRPPCFKCCMFHAVWFYLTAVSGEVNGAVTWMWKWCYNMIISSFASHGTHYADVIMLIIKKCALVQHPPPLCRNIPALKKGNNLISFSQNI